MGGKRKNPPDRSSSSAEETPDCLDPTLTAIIEAYDRRMAELQLLLISNQERRLAEVKAEHATIVAELKFEMSGLRSEITELRSEIPEMRKSVDFIHKEIEDIKSVHTRQNATEGQEDMQNRLAKVERSVHSLELHVDNLDNHSRRNNLRIDGVVETPGESWETTEIKCHKLFADLNLHNLQVERAHRTGPKQDGQPRTIVVKMRSFKERELVLTKAKQERPRGIYYNEDFSARVSKIRKELRPELQRLRRNGVSAYLSFDRIKYRAEPGNPRNQHPMPDQHRGHSSQTQRKQSTPRPTQDHCNDNSTPPYSTKDTTHVKTTMDNTSDNVSATSSANTLASNVSLDTTSGDSAQT